MSSSLGLARNLLRSNVFSFNKLPKIDICAASRRCIGSTSNVMSSPHTQAPSNATSPSVPSPPPNTTQPPNSTATSPMMTIAEVKHKLIEYMGLEPSYRPLQKNRDHLLELLPKTQEELPIRKMKDSFASAIIPLSSDIAMQQRYVTFLGHVRLGRLMEDMDIFAVWVAFKHLSNPKQTAIDPTPYVMVTVLVDQIDFTDITPKPDADIRLTGHASWVGKSTIEITVWLEQKHANEWLRITRATFLLAARNATNTAAALVNKLVAETTREKAILLKGEVRKKNRLLKQQQSLLKKMPDVNELHVIHNLFLETVDNNDPTFHRRVLPSYSLWMDDAKLSTVVICHPEDRNMHNRVFGGFLMRQALELAWTTAYFIGKFRPALRTISDIGFHQPVAIGSMLRMEAQVVYNEFQYMQVVVNAEVFDPHSGQHRTTNIFHYTFEVPEQAINVVPRSYHEAMMFLDGRRHFQQVMNLTSEPKA